MSDVQVHRWRKQQKDIDLDTPEACMGLREARRWLDNAEDSNCKEDREEDAFLSQAHALISIAESLEKLASCVQSPDNKRPYLRTK